jgi:dihydroorotate dehydrogenase (NAD+) catalytic subunit
VAIGTANFYEPQTALNVIEGIREFMQRHGIQDVRELIGGVQTSN